MMEVRSGEAQRQPAVQGGQDAAGGGGVGSGRFGGGPHVLTFPSPQPVAPPASSSGGPASLQDSGFQSFPAVSEPIPLPPLAPLPEPAPPVLPSSGGGVLAGPGQLYPGLAGVSGRAPLADSGSAGGQ